MAAKKKAPVRKTRKPTKAQIVKVIEQAMKELIARLVEHE